MSEQTKPKLFWSFDMAEGAPALETAPTLVEDGSFVAFDHVAAGHEGIQSDASNGSIVIKPCTPAEIAFYESAAEHTEFQSHLPAYIGKLTLNNAVTPEHLLNGDTLLQSLSTATPSTATLSNGLMSPVSPPSSFQHQPQVQSQSSASKRTSWKPSGGKKLDTGLAIVLENVAHGFKQPNIMDVKLGARLWADDAPTAKRQKLDDQSRQSTSGSLGFRIAGMTIWRGRDDDSTKQKPPANGFQVKNGFRRYDKTYGRSFTQANVKLGFMEYLGGTDANGRLKSIRSKLIARRIVRELESVQYVLENEESRMYSASILMVYEGDEQALGHALQEERLRREADRANDPQIDEQELGDNANDNEEEEDEDEDENEVPKVYDLRLIDFAHAEWTPGQGPDENALQGVRSVLKIFYEILQQDAGNSDADRQNER